MAEAMVFLGLWVGFVALWFALHAAYRSIYHMRRSLKIARAMNKK